MTATQLCPRCSQPMANLGNVSGRYFLTHPAMWEEVWACHGCQVKRTVRVRASLPPDYSYLERFEEG